LHWIDIAVVAIYLAGTLVLGLGLARRMASAQDYFLAGRKLPFWAIGMSLVVSDIGALEMVGGTGGAYLYGISQANFEWIGCVPAMILGGLVFIPLLWREGVYSIPEFLGRRYGAPVRAFLAIVGVLFMGAALGIFFQASAAMMANVLGWDRWTCIYLTAAVVGIYTVGGGLTAVVVTDVVQCIVLFIGGITLAAIGLIDIGGPAALADGLAASSAQHHLELLLKPDLAKPTDGYPWPGILLGLGLVLSPAYWLGNQAIVQRTLGARDAWTAKASMIFGAGLKTIVPMAFVLPGLLAVVLLGAGTVAKPDAVYAKLIELYVPIGLRGVLYAAFLAALMSSVDSYTNSAATLFTQDLYRIYIARGREERHYLRVGRIASGALIALGVFMVPVVDRFSGIYEAFQTYLSYFQGPTLALILGAIASKRSMPIAGIASLAGGMVTSVVLIHRGDVHYLNAAWWSFVVSASLLAAVGWAERVFAEPAAENEPT